MTSDSMTAAMPEWMPRVLGVDAFDENAPLQLRGQPFVVRGGILRSRKLVSAAQEQTSGTFGFKWQRRDTFESPASLGHLREWLVARYGDVQAVAWLAEHGDRPLLLDAGCGAAMSALELFGPILPRVKYLGVDVSEAVEVARARFAERGLSAGFMQADITDLPLAPESVDVIFSEGVLHHTNSTEHALKALATLLKRGGRFMFYVYRRKGPVREFTDDYIRERLQAMSPPEAWQALEPLTRLGIALGELDAEVEIPEPIELLGIPAGPTTVQRLFYWHVAKVFYRKDFSFDEMNHVNFDWYAPANAHRQSPDEVRRWCAEAALEIERFVVEEAGITVIARKTQRMSDASERGGESEGRRRSEKD
jgi:arsenite methyltransferase